MSLIDEAARFKAPKPYPYEPISAYFARLAEAVEDWVNQNYPAPGSKHVN